MRNIMGVFAAGSLIIASAALAQDSGSNVKPLNAHQRTEENQIVKVCSRILADHLKSIGYVYDDRVAYLYKRDGDLVLVSAKQYLVIITMDCTFFESKRYPDLEGRPEVQRARFIDDGPTS